MSLQYFKRTEITHGLGLSSNAQTILEFLLFSSLKEGSAWPTISTIAKKAGCSTRTVQTIIRDLDSKGLITIKERTQPNGMPNSHRYTPTAELLNAYRKAIHIIDTKPKSLKQKIKDAGPESGRVMAIAICSRVLVMAGLLPEKTAFQQLDNLLHIYATSQTAVDKSIEITKAEINMNDLDDIDEIIAGSR